MGKERLRMDEVNENEETETVETEESIDYSDQLTAIQESINALYTPCHVLMGLVALLVLFRAFKGD